MFLGYNTNGFAHHDLFDAVEILAELGYRGVAITIDHGVLSPMNDGHQEQIERLGELLEEYGMRSVIETGARYLLDPWNKHEPTLISAVPELRSKFYRYAIECADILGSDCVSIWSGAIRDGISREEAFERLAGRLPEILDFAGVKGVPLAFEPEPGMLIDTTAEFERLTERIEHAHGERGHGTQAERIEHAHDERGHGTQVERIEHAHDERGHGTLGGTRDGTQHPFLQLTLDIGHLQCQGETPMGEVIRRFAPRLANVHIEDMRRGVHEHLMFGEGEIDFPPVLQALGEAGYTKGVYVELSRHSHEAPEAARRAIEFLGPLVVRSAEC